MNNSKEKKKRNLYSVVNKYKNAYHVEGIGKRHPFAIDPIEARPQIRGREVEDIAIDAPDNIARRGIENLVDLAGPPAIMVESLDLVADEEVAGLGRRWWGAGPDVEEVDDLVVGLGGVGLGDNAVVVDGEPALFDAAADDRGLEPGAGEARVTAADFYFASSVKHFASSIKLGCGW